MLFLNSRTSILERKLTLKAMVTSREQAVATSAVVPPRSSKTPESTSSALEETLGASRTQDAYVADIARLE